MERIGVLLVDDHSIVRSGLRLLLGQEADMEVVGEAGSGEEAIRLTRLLKPDVVVMDLVMPGMNGIEATRRLRHMFPEVRLVALTMCEDEFHVREMIQAGVQGYVVKNSHVSQLVEAVRLAARGESYLPPALASRLFADLRGAPVSPRDTRRKLLTTREHEVLRMVSSGSSTKEIASQLSISVHTVGRHVSNIMNKLSLHSRTELVRYAIRAGLAEEPGYVQANVEAPRFNHAHSVGAA